MKKNSNSKKAQEYILDLTDFTVDGSDYAGSYGNFSKFFEDDLEAIRFQQEVMDYISEQVYTGKAKFYLNDSFTTPYAFFPLERMERLEPRIQQLYCCERLRLQRRDRIGSLGGKPACTR